MTPRMEPDWLTVEEARRRILAAVSGVGVTRMPISACLGYVLAEDLVSPIDLPAHDNSAMDGFALRAADIAGASRANPRDLAVVADTAAGAVAAGPLRAGSAVRVMTGAPVPPGADSVVRVEHTDGGRVDAAGIGTVSILSDDDSLRNIRPRGEDIRRGELVLHAGRTIRPGELAVAASMGNAELQVVRRPVVGVLTSGDELVDVRGFDQVLSGRRIVSTNSYSLAAQLEEVGIEARDLGISPDTREGLRERLEAAHGCDALITSAGISMGERDLVRGVLSEMGAEIDFWRVKMRPGSPFAFGHIGRLGGIPWFGLPGNPVSSMVTFEVLARPAILKMCGRSEVFAPTLRAVLTQEHRPAPGLMTFLRVTLDRRGEVMEATPTGAQGSGILRSMAAADALMVLTEDSSGRKGESFDAIVLGGAPLRADPGY